MIYKALFLDVDGTLIPYIYDALPSDKVTIAVQKAQEKLTVILVTGRSFGFIPHILEKLQITKGFAIVNNGANVINLETKEIIYDQPIEKESVSKILDILFDNKIPFYLKQKFNDDAYSKGPFVKETKIEKAYMFFTKEDLEKDLIKKALRELKHIPSITAHKAQHGNPNKYGLNITHVNATKLHGVEKVFEELNLKREETIAVGDGYNDFPLLMAAGLKVAMGNAIEDLKQIADYVAPGVEIDGVADVIEKYIL